MVQLVESYRTQRFSATTTLNCEAPTQYARVEDPASRAQLAQPGLHHLAA